MFCCHIMIFYQKNVENNMSNKAFFLCGLVLVSTLMTGFEVLINAEYQGNLGP